jgi:hypothetical protein
MCKGSKEHLFRLQKLNDFIARLHNATELDSELNANFIGFVGMIRDFPDNIWAKIEPKIKELEHESFNNIVERLGRKNKKREKLIIEKVRGLNNFLNDGRIDLEGMYYEESKIIDKIVKRSLYDSFGPDQLCNFKQTGDTYRVVDDALRSNIDRLSSRSLGSFNPGKGISYAHNTGLFYSSEIDHARIQVRYYGNGGFRLRRNAYDLHSFIGIEEINEIKNDIFQYVPLCSGSSDYTLGFDETAYIEDLLSAYGHDFMVDIIFGAPKKIGFSFIRLRTDERTQPLLVPYLLFPPKWGFPDKMDLMNEAMICSNIAALIFFETLRVMVANKRLSGCPMRFIPWAVRTPFALKKFWYGNGNYDHLSFPRFGHRFLADTECCGRVDLLMRLYEVGKKAGFPEETWKQPIECFRCSSPSGGDEISQPLHFPFKQRLLDWLDSLSSIFSR